MQLMESWRPLFVGRCNNTSVRFICFSTGGYAVVQEEQIICRGEGADALPRILDLFLSMIDRPMRASTQTNELATDARRRFACAS